MYVQFLIGIVFGILISIIVINFLKKSDKTECTDKIITLIRGCARWAVASKQDTSPLISLLHANYSAGYLWAIKDIYTSEEINKLTGINIIHLQNEITSIQDAATKKVTNICPMFVKELLETEELARLAGDV